MKQVETTMQGHAICDFNWIHKESRLESIYELNDSTGIYLE